MKTLILTIISVMCSVLAYSQDSLYADSLTDEQVEYEFFYKTKFQLEFASSRAFLAQNTSINITGIHLGVQFRHHYKFGVTFLNSEQYLTQVDNDPVIKYESHGLTGAGVYFEYVIIENYRYYLSVPLTLANTVVRSVPYDYSDNPIPVRSYESPNFPFTSLGVSGGYSVLYWLALSGGVGYRNTFADDPEVKSVLSTPYYNFGLKFRFGRFVKNVMQRDHVLKMKSVYFRERNREKSDKFDARYFELIRKKEQKLKKRNERKATAK